jgi:hypothetical protein
MGGAQWWRLLVRGRGAGGSRVGPPIYLLQSARKTGPKKWLRWTEFLNFLGRWGGVGRPSPNGVVPAKVAA